jgi:hypothetical protein
MSAADRELTMTGTMRLTDRWPTALALVSIAGAITAIALLDREEELFGPIVVMMAAIYLMAYALGRQWTAWIALAVLSAVVSVLYALHLADVLPFDPAVGMSVVAVLLWLWTVARRRFADGPIFALQTAGLVGFGAITLVCAALAPRWGLVLAGVGFLAHAAWDAYHFRINRVVNRPYAEFCGVIDVVVGPALIVAAFV